MLEFLKSDISRIFRYAYSGFFLVALLSFTEPTFLQSLKDPLPTAIWCLAVIAVGACIFIFYRCVIGELILFNVVHFFSFCLSEKMRKPWSCTYLLSSKVSWGHRRAAYTFLRESSNLFAETITNRIKMVHNEIHVLYVAALELVAVAIYGHCVGRSYVFSVATIATVVMGGALIFDLHQHHVEASLLNSIDDGKLNEELNKGGFLKKSGKQ